MKRLYIYLFLLFNLPVFSQTPSVVWDKTIGGSYYDAASSIISTSDGGFVVAGSSYSNISGDKSENSKGNLDYWIVKLNANGQKVWDKTIGGSSYDEASSIIASTDGGFIIAGTSTSDISGNKSEKSKGESDYWIIKLNANGQKVWDKTIGGSFDDRAYSIISSTNGGIVIAGSSDSNISGDKSENSKGQSDFWIIKLDANGQKNWDKTIGGSSSDGANSIISTSDGGFIIAGTSLSGISGDKSENLKNSLYHFWFDYWIVKLNGNGQKVWDKTIGGNSDDRAQSIISTSDGGFIIAGISLSGISGDKTKNSNGKMDFWIVKLKEQLECNSSSYVRGLNISSFENNALDGYWEENLYNVSSFEYQFKNTNSNTWSSVFITSNDSIRISNQTPGNSYHYRVRATCIDNSKSLWKNSPTLFFNKEQPTIQYPATVTTNTLTNGQSIQVEGKRFTPNGRVVLEIRGISGFGQDYNLFADENGEFDQFVDVTPTMQSGTYTIKGVDYGVTTGARIASTTSTTGTPANKVLEFNVNLTSNIVALTIPFAKFDESNLHVNFFWRDFLSVIPPYNTYLNAQGKRRVKYKLELGREVTPGNITWIQTQPLIDRYEKPSESKLFYEKIFPTTSLSAGKYVVRVTDELKTTNTLTSLPFDFIPVSPSISITKHWDYTYPDFRNSTINSIAADGVSRLYLKTLIGNAAVTKVKVELMDENNSTTPLPSILGKLKVATNITSWSAEANDANQKSIFVNSKIGDSFWCWYVAPDNFADGTTYSFSKVRTVKIKITGYSSANVEVISKIEDIIIERPPLYLVHGLDGLGGSDGTWKNFSHRIGGNARSLFESNQSGLFSEVYSPQMEASSSHQTNSNIFLKPLSSYDNRSFQTNIYELRKEGKVVSAFDYVAHSMGGCMLRSAIDDASKFYVDNNYGKGYIHKFITLTTPHNGSPLGDIVNAVAKEEYFSGIQSFIRDKGTQLKKLSAYFRTDSKGDLIEPSFAVKDFVMANGQGGRKFGIVTKTKSHVIVSDYVNPNSKEGSQTAIWKLDDANDDHGIKELGSTKNGLNLLAGIIKHAARNKAVIDKNNIVLNRINQIDNDVSFALDVEGLNTSQETADFMNYYSGYLVPAMENYLFESDIIVPLSSQLAGLPITASNVTHNKIGVGGNYLNFVANHNFLPAKICDNDVIGDRVLDLLNADVNSSLFGDLNASPYYSSGTTASISKVDENPKGNSINTVNEPLIESRRIISKARIEAPMGQEVIPFGSEKDVKTFISDTTNLISAKIIIGNEILALPKTNANTLNYLFDNISLGSQKIYLEAVYSYGLDSLITYWDSVSININNGQTPQALALSQQDMYIFKGDTLSLNLGLKYATYSGNINSSNGDVDLVSSNTAKVTIVPGSKNVIALDTGFVMLTYTYKGLSINQFVTVLNKQLLCKYCPAQISHSNSILAGEYDAHETIESIANVPNNTYYYAGKAIILKPGFSAGINETFLAEIRKCEGLETISTEGLVAYYPFDGNANDASGNGNNGVVTGPTLTSDRFGVSNKAYNFGGFSGSSIIRIPNSTTTQFTNTFSISHWYYQNTYAGMNGYGNNVSNGYHMLFAKEADWGGFYAGVSSNVSTDSVYYNHTNKPNYNSVDYNVNAKSKGLTNNLNTWIHMTYTVQNGVAKIFRNGVKIGEKILSQNVNLGTANTKDLFFGRYSSTWYPLNGKLDDIRIYNRALSDAEVTSLYNQEKL